LRRRAEARTATWTAKAGDPDASLPIFRALLVESPDRALETFSPHNNIAYWTGESGDWARAHALAERLVAECEAVLGSRHPETLAARRCGRCPPSRVCARSADGPRKISTSCTRAASADRPDR
jgi:hypothetical protein